VDTGLGVTHEKRPTWRAKKGCAIAALFGSLVAYHERL